jgi:hypothetical protein
MKFTHSQLLATLCTTLLACTTWPAPLLGAEPTPSQPNPPSEPAALAVSPAAEAVLARFVKEIGGKEAFDKIQSQHLTGKFEMSAQGLNGALEVLAKRPNRLLIKITLPGVGELLQGFDGAVGWTADPVTGPRLLEGEMLEQIREQANFDAVLHERARFKSIRNNGVMRFEGKDCLVLKLVKASGRESTEYYDGQTGLLVGSTEVQETPLGAMPVTGVIGEYKKFGDILFATRLSEAMGPLTQVMSFQTMEFNTVDDSVFALPGPIKELLKK